MDKAGLRFSPCFDSICELFEKVVDSMVLSVNSLPHVDQLLFQPVELLANKIISSVKLPEEVVLLAKHKIRKVIEANRHGPEKWVYLLNR